MSPAYTDCGGGLCTFTGSTCDACRDADYQPRGGQPMSDQHPRTDRAIAVDAETIAGLARGPIAHELASACADLVGPTWVAAWALSAMGVDDETLGELIESAQDAVADDREGEA